MSAKDCIARLVQAAGRQLTDDEVNDIFTRIHKAAIDIKAGRALPEDVALGKTKLGKEFGKSLDPVVRQAAERAAAELAAESALAERQANLQALRLAGLSKGWRELVASGVKPLDALDLMIARDYSGRVNIESLEQRVAGYTEEFRRHLLPVWDALGDDFASFWQDRGKLRNLLSEMRGEDTGDAVAKKGAQAWKETAERARKAFNENGGNVGRLDDWGFPQHHSQELVSRAGREAWLQTLSGKARAAAAVSSEAPPRDFARDAWIDNVMPLLDRSKYVDDVGGRLSDAELRRFLGKAWENIATDGLATREPGAFTGAGKVTNRHAEHRQIHFKDADSVIHYWETFGERSAFEILHGHIERMARDIAFVEKFGPNPQMSYRTLRDMALIDTAKAEPAATGQAQKRAAQIDNLWDYSSGKTKPPANARFAGIADGIANLNVAGKLGGASIASFYGDKVMFEAVSHLNDIPMVQRWRTEIAALNPVNKADRRMLMEQGLMLDSIRSGLNRFYEGLGKSGVTGKMANAVMRITGMNAINEIRKGAFGAGLYSSIGNEIAAGKSFSDLSKSDVRALKHMGVTNADWKVWRLAQLQDMGVGSVKLGNALTPDAVARIPDADIVTAGLVTDIADAGTLRNNALIKLLGAVNTESEFAVVTPGWRERALFYGSLQRGTVSGEITRSVLQFKSFPWAYFKRGMDAVANAEGPFSKAVMVAYLVSANALAGAMIIQTREMLAGKDPRKMAEDDWYKFWGAAFLQGGALGIYGDFLYSVKETRYGSGPLEALAGPTMGPLLELGIVQPLQELSKAIEGKETHLMAKSLQDLKGFVPGGNIWYTKAALDHLIWQQVFEAMSPGYLSNIRRRTAKEYGQDWWWSPGETTPERTPDIKGAFR